MRRSPILIVAAVLLAVVAGLAAAPFAGTVTVAEENFGTIRKIKFAWTSSAGGAADGTTTFTYNGAIERLVTVPDSGTAPTDNYDITIVDEDNTDVLHGAGADRDTANTEQVLRTSLGVVANDKLTLHVTNAGAAKLGVVYLYIR